MCSVSGYKCSVGYVSSVGYQMMGNCLVLRYMYLSITSICLVSGYSVVSMPVHVYVNCWDIYQVLGLYLVHMSGCVSKLCQVFV